MRYEQRYAFNIDAPDLKYLSKALYLLARLSADRVRHELNLGLNEKNAANILGRLAELNALKSIHPSLPWNRELWQQLEAGLDAVPPVEWGRITHLARIPQRMALGYLLWFIRLSSDEIETLDSRLHFPALLRDAILAAANLSRDCPGLSKTMPVDVFDRLDHIPPLAIYSAYLTGDQACREIMNRYMVTWRFITLKTTGDDLIARGLLPGPMFRTILRELRSGWLEGQIRSGDDEAIFLEKLIRDQRA